MPAYCQSLNSPVKEEKLTGLECSLRHAGPSIPDPFCEHTNDGAPAASSASPSRMFPRSYSLSYQICNSVFIYFLRITMRHYAAKTCLREPSPVC